MQGQELDLILVGPFQLGIFCDFLNACHCKELTGFKKGSMLAFKLPSGANVESDGATCLSLSGMFPLLMEERLTFGASRGQTSVSWNKIVTLIL